jgi:hypothetical protein
VLLLLLTKCAVTAAAAVRMVAVSWHQVYCIYERITMTLPT